MDKKNKIYYAHTYRRIDVNWIKNIIFAGMIIIPSLILVAVNIDGITDSIVRIATEILSKVISERQMHVMVSQYSVLGEMKYVELPTVYPEFSLNCWNLLICILILLLLGLMRKTKRPLAVFGIFGILIHIVSCVYFMLRTEEFPYTLGDYSELYLKQQIGIWLTFIVLAGLILGFMGNKGYVSKVVTFLCIMIYSFVFGTIRYILFLFILYQFSVLYMAILFFVFGPVFDFSYFVAVYAVFMNKNIKDYEFGKKKGVWQWS